MDELGKCTAEKTLKQKKTEGPRKSQWAAQM